jgi:uncharacterized protein
MLCPVCNVYLLKSTRENVEIDCCPRCGGIWLDHGELFTMLNSLLKQQRNQKGYRKQKVKIS